MTEKIALLTIYTRLKPSDFKNIDSKRSRLGTAELTSVEKSRHKLTSSLVATLFPIIKLEGEGMGVTV